MSDNDGTDILRCRWANANSGTNFNRRDECEDACMGLNGISTLYPDNCTIVFTLPTTRVNWYYVIALQIEDYYDASSTTPMSSVPIQFLLYAYSPSGSCTTRPEIIGDRPNRGKFCFIISRTRYLSSEIDIFEELLASIVERRNSVIVISITDYSDIFSFTN